MGLVTPPGLVTRPTEQVTVPESVLAAVLQATKQGKSRFTFGKASRRRIVGMVLLGEKPIIVLRIRRMATAVTGDLQLKQFFWLITDRRVVVFHQTPAARLRFQSMAIDLVGAHGIEQTKSGIQFLLADETTVTMTTSSRRRRHATYEALQGVLADIAG